MDGFFGIDPGRHVAVDIKRMGRLQPAVSGLLILLDNSKVLHPQPADRNRHPAVLIVMIVDARDLPYLPTDGDQFEAGVLEDQVSGVMALAEEQVRRQALLVDGMLSK